MAKTRGRTPLVRATTVLAAVGLAILLLGVTLVAPAGPLSPAPAVGFAAGRDSTAGSATTRTSRAPSTAGDCRRNTAADLRWITWLHRTFAGRELTLAAAAPWLDRLTDGQSYAAVAAAVASSVDSNRRSAEQLSPPLLHRRALSTDELAGWAARVAALGPDAVGVQFLASAEAWTRAGSSPTRWIDQTYRDVLGRPADAAGTAYWAGRLAAGESRGRVAEGLWWSPDAVRRRVGEVYVRLLDRRADPAGLAY